MSKQRKNIGIGGKITEPLLIVPEPRVFQRIPPYAPSSCSSVPAQLKYIKLLQVIEMLGRDLKICYTGVKIDKSLPKVERELAKACSLVQQYRAELRRVSGRHS